VSGTVTGWGQLSTSAEENSGFLSIATGSSHSLALRSDGTQFSLPESQTVKLEVFNVLGQRVALLINNEQLTAGTHNLTFDASRLSSGMYIYRLEASQFVQTRKLTLIK